MKLTRASLQRTVDRDFLNERQADALWSGLSLQHSDSKLSKFIYFCINLGLIVTGVILERRVFVVFGAIGCAAYLLFPMVLTLIGLGIVYLGVFWLHNEALITGKTRALPVAVRELLVEWGP
jgi:hypothetical protein